MKEEGRRESKKSSFLKQPHLTSKHKQTEDDGPKPKRGRQYQTGRHVSGFSLRILVARERCNILQENILNEASCLNKTSHKLPNISQIILRCKWRTLRSPMPDEHPDVLCNDSIFACSSFIFGLF